MSLTLTLPERLDLSTLPEAVEPLLRALRARAGKLGDSRPSDQREKPRCLVDGSPLKRFDSSALAALIALIREGNQLGLGLGFEHLPEGLLTLASVYGVGAELAPGLQ